MGISEKNIKINRNLSTHASQQGHVSSVVQRHFSEMSMVEDFIFNFYQQFSFAFGQQKNTCIIKQKIKVQICLHRYLTLPRRMNWA